MPLLEIAGLQAGYGAGPVLKDLDLHVEEGEIVALLGSNGAGKSTTLRAVSRAGAAGARADRVRRGVLGRSGGGGDRGAWAWRTCRRAAGCSPG